MRALNPLSAEKFLKQYENCIADFEIKAIKIGLIPNLEIAKAIERILTIHDVPVVMDPVMSATSGGQQAAPNVLEFVRKALFPKVTLLTPNLPEIQNITDNPNWSVEKQVRHLIGEGLSACLVKGGHGDQSFVSDYLANAFGHFYCYQPRLNKNVRGTGCVLASSLACYLAQGEDIRDAVILSRSYINRGIREAQSLGPYQLFSHQRKPVELHDIPRLSYTPDLIGKSFSFPECPDRLGIYPVVDSADWINRLLTIGIKTIQLRLKQTDNAFLNAEVASAVDTAQQHGDIQFFVNDHWRIAIDSGAYGVHLGQEDLHDADLLEIENAGLRLGISTHSYWELARALAVNPSYIALGPIFETDSKQMPWQPQGFDLLAEWIRLLEGHTPLVAIGGIDLPRAKELHKTGVGSVAMISAITKATDYQQVTHDLLALWSLSAN
jgi:hydroxymethylpyrimidine kinase/phosphomethylpyrimidine kinase/thiamine-phosphate diphosphorylase